MTLQIPSWYRLLTILAFFSSLSAAAYLPAFAAQPVNKEPSVTLKFGDVNLNTDTGRRELLDRLSKAADHVCRERVRVISPLDAFGYRRAYLLCYRDTLAAVVDKVHHSQLSALFVALSRS